MPIHSYLVYPHTGEKKALITNLNKISGCETLESRNDEIVILVTDTESDFQEGLLQEDLKLLPQIQGMALVYGQEE